MDCAILLHVAYVPRLGEDRRSEIIPTFYGLCKHGRFVLTLQLSDPRQDLAHRIRLPYPMVFCRHQASVERLGDLAERQAAGVVLTDLADDGLLRLVSHQLVISGSIPVRNLPFTLASVTVLRDAIAVEGRQDHRMTHAGHRGDLPGRQLAVGVELLEEGFAAQKKQGGKR